LCLVPFLLQYKVLEHDAVAHPSQHWIIDPMKGNEM